MMYSSGAAFRRALEDRLRSEARRSGLPLIRLRKMVAFERFVGRLVQDRPGCWLIKGGLALQWRLGSVARTTKDLDMLLTAPVADIHQALVQAALLDLGDWFRFLVRQPVRPAQIGGGLRFGVQSLLDGRPFEGFHADIGWGDPVVAPPDELVAPTLLGFAGIPPVVAPCYPVTQHLAEKVHAYTRSRARGESSRVKDLVDIVVIAQTSAVNGSALHEALEATFDVRGTHPMPSALPDPPNAWTSSFRSMARGLGWPDTSLSTGLAVARAFLEPILRGQVTGVWDSASCSWRS